MKRIFIYVILNIVLCNFVCAKDSFTVYEHNFNPVFSKENLNNLSYVENIIFNRNYSKDTVENRLERLELKIYGAIQYGKLLTRINNIKNAVTNISQGGKGLQYDNKIFGLAGINTISTNYSFDNTNKEYSSRHSHRLPPPPHHSHRIYYPDNYTYNYNPYTNGNFSNNYSLGTSIKILNDD